MSATASAPAAASTVSVAVPAGSIVVFAAASLTDVFKRAAEEITARNVDAHVRFDFGSSSTLVTQIINGAPADVFASADEPNMRKLIDAKLVDGDAPYFVGNRLEIAVAPGNPRKIMTLADLAKPGVVVVLAAPSVPAGSYAVDSLRRAGVTVTPASQEVDVRSVLNKVALGEADAGIVYVTDVLSAGARVVGVEIPERYQVVARYPVAVVKDAKAPGLARAFVDYLLSSEGQKLMAGFGFSTP